MSERKSRSELDISGFHIELERLLSQYREANCCPGCLAETLVKAGVATAVTTDTVCWPADSPEEVDLIVALARLMNGRPVGAPSGETLQ